MIATIKHYAADITLNLVNAVYLVKEWVLLQIGVQVTAAGMVDKAIAWAVGMTIIVFNIVRITKQVLDIKERKKNTKEDEDN